MLEMIYEYLTGLIYNTKMDVTSMDDDDDDVRDERDKVDAGRNGAGEVNGGFLGDTQSMAGSRKSLNLHPVLLMPQPGEVDRYSEFSNRTGRSKSSGFRPEYGTSIQNFQL
ncbi:hypothetical protein LSTR_LSTR014906 [Laodelphax striatellus]|uniref:Uncharacterized protein n=1 Tax=Laodelphax striatellus TaxID=195883 RepID=A0A482XBK7_LAOST|nr:hypothetical protein LSTR_LSTR014906 [Laodelphax striatellus]